MKPEPAPLTSRATSSRLARAGLLSLLLLAGLSSCKSSGSTTASNRFRQMLRSNAPYTPAELGSAIMGFADDFNMKVTQACADMVAGSRDVRERALALQNQVGTVNATLTIATAPNPVVSMLDMVVYVSLKRAVLEEAATQGPEAPRIAKLYAVLEQGETEIWRIASSVLSPTEQEDVRELLRRWLRDHPGQRIVSHIRFAEFNRYRLETARDRAPRSWSVFQLLYLDPLAGADPVAQEIHETRMFAERAYYYMARIPGVLRWQIELLYLQLLLEPDTRQVLGDITRLTTTAEKAANTLDTLAPTLRHELDGVVTHAREEIAKERQAILDAIHGQSETLRPLAAELKSTLDAGARMATAVDGGVKSLDGFVGRFVPATAPGAAAQPTPASAPPPDSEGRPFDVLDYGKSASQIREAAAELRELITAVDRTLADPASPNAAGIRKAAADVDAAAQALLHRAFLYGLGLALLILVALPISWRLATRGGRARSAAPREP